MRKNEYAKHRKAIREEIPGILRQQDIELLSYAFTQHALRELRAHTSMWTAALKANAPAALVGRRGQEQTRATVSEILQRQAHWPFHLAGDSGACLFNHRAWVSWRCLALLELPSLQFHELPCLSKDLQTLIENTRRNTESSEHLSPLPVQDILFKFFHDSACGNIKGNWLRRALKLTKQTEDIVVEKILTEAVENIFTVLQSLLNVTDGHGDVILSSGFVACAALFFIYTTAIAKRLRTFGNLSVCKSGPRELPSPRRCSSATSPAKNLA